MRVEKIKEILVIWEALRGGVAKIVGRKLERDRIWRRNDGVRFFPIFFYANYFHNSL